MKRFLSSLVVGILMISMLLSSVITASAESDDGIMPCYSNCNICSVSFVVDDSGIGHADVTYAGISGAFSEARITVKIQKKFLLVFWKTVDIGYPDNKWVASSTDINGYIYNSFNLDGSGTYKALFTVEIIGVDGSVDLIEDSIQSKY